MNIVFGVAQDQNASHRSHMEDTYRVVADVGGYFYAAVFDGHGGKEVSFLAQLDLHNEPALQDQALPVDQRLMVAFEAFDERVCRKNTTAGATAVVVMISPSGETWVAWSGDSLLLLADQTSHKLVTPPHNMDDPEERERVQNAGGERESGSYVRISNGWALGMTRAFGDTPFKKVGVIATPSTKQLLLPPGARLLLASDGIYSESKNVALHQVAITLMRGRTPQEAANMIVSAAKRKWDSDDNLTAVVIEAFA